jgi:hypothetical protein
LFQVGFHGLRIECFRFALHHVEGSLGAFPKTGAKAVAVDFGYQAGLPINDLKGAFGAGNHALAASVAPFFVDFDDLSYRLHGHFSSFGSVVVEA